MNTMSSLQGNSDRCREDVNTATLLQISCIWAKFFCVFEFDLLTCQ